MAIINKALFWQIFGSGAAPTARDGGYATPDDRPVLLALARTIRPRVVVELGVQAGTTAALLLRECPWIERYIGVDVPADFEPAMPKQKREVPPKGQAGSLVLEDKALAKRFELVILAGGTAELDPNALPDADMVYVDASHAEADVVHDIALARMITRPGGAIAYHDYPSCQGVHDAVDAANRTSGNSICLVDGTWMCFELRRSQDPRPAPTTPPVPAAAAPVVAKKTKGTTAA